MPPSEAPVLVVSPVPAPTPPPRIVAPSGPPKSNPAPPVAAGAATALAPAKAGAYLFTETGNTRIQGCLALSQAIPNPTKLRVDSPNGALQHFERDERDALGMGALTGADFEYRPDGIYLRHLRQTQTLALSSAPVEFEASPPVLATSGRPFVGQSWAFTLVSQDSQVRVETRNAIQAVDEAVSLAGGQSVRADKVLSSAHITGQSSQGSLDLVRTSTVWFARELSLDVKEVIDTKGRVGLCSVDAQTEATLRST